MNERRPSRVPVRGVLALGLTAVSLGLLLSFRTPDVPAGGIALAAPDRFTATAPPATAPTVGETAPPTSVPTTGETAPTPASEVGLAVTLMGDPIEIRWGDVQVSVTVEAGRIVDVETIQVPSGDRRSLRISERAEPVLREQAIERGSADVDVVSGATYTSIAYAYSLQSALDQLGA